MGEEMLGVWLLSRVDAGSGRLFFGTLRVLSSIPLS